MNIRLLRTCSIDLCIALSISEWLTLLWQAIDGKATAFKLSYHKRCYWPYFDVADGDQASTPTIQNLCRKHAKNPENWRKEEEALKTMPVYLK